LRKFKYEQEFINPPPGDVLSDVEAGSRNKFIQHGRLIGWGPEE